MPKEPSLDDFSSESEFSSLGQDKSSMIKVGESQSRSDPDISGLLMGKVVISHRATLEADALGDSDFSDGVPTNKISRTKTNKKKEGLELLKGLIPEGMGLQ